MNRPLLFKRPVYRALGLISVFITIVAPLCTPAQTGYIYVHYRAMDESQAPWFSYNTGAGSFDLDDRPNHIAVRDLGIAQNGRMWAISNADGKIHFRNGNSTIWQEHSSTLNFTRIDGRGGDEAVAISGGNVYLVTASSANLIGTGGSGGNFEGNTPFDVGGSWTTNNHYVCTTNGRVYQYSGSDVTWTRVGNLEFANHIDVNPTNNRAIVIKNGGGNAGTVYEVQSDGTETSLGKASGITAGQDVAATGAGDVFARFGNGYVHKWISGTTWSVQEEQSRNTALANTVSITGGAGHNLWMTFGTNPASDYGTLFKRVEVASGQPVYIDDERVKPSGTHRSNSRLIAVTPGPYMITQTGFSGSQPAGISTAGWELQRIFVYDPTGGGTSNITSATGGNVNVDVADGETVHIVFQNGRIFTTDLDNDCSKEFMEDFGTGSVNNDYGPLTGQTTYHYAGGTGGTPDGYYRVRTETNFFTSPSGRFDHTAKDGTGRMLLINASYQKDEFFRRKFTGLITSLPYRFTVWLNNHNGGIPPNIKLEIIEPSDKTVLASEDTGPLTSQGLWVPFTFSFIPTSSEIEVALTNNTIGGTGNDFLVDDISFGIDAPGPLVTTVTHLACGAAAGSISVTSPLGPVYEYRLNDGSWLSSPDFTGLAAGSYTVSVRLVGSTNCENSKGDIVRQSVCGNVLNDVNGLTDNIVNGSAIGTLPGEPLYAILYDDTSGEVVDMVEVASDGSYSLGAIAGNDATIYISTTPAGIGQTGIPEVDLPDDWEHTGENNCVITPACTGSDSAPDGVLSLGTVSGPVTEANFGIQQPPTAVSSTLPAQPNPGGDANVSVPATAFKGNDQNGGIVTDITITAFPEGAETITIGGNTYTPGNFPTGGVTIPVDANGNPTVPVAVNPEDGTVDVIIAYTAIDNAGAVSEPATVTLSFEDVSISGTVFHDPNGLTDGNVNGTGTGTAGGPLYVSLVDPVTNSVLQTIPVDVDGTYTFSGLTPGTGYTVVLTDDPAGSTSSPYAGSGAEGWASTGESSGGTADGTVDGAITVNTGTGGVASVNLGIQQPPVAYPESTSITPPSVGTIVTLDGQSGNPPVPSGNDEEDGPLGSGGTIVITTLPTNTMLLYNDTPVTAGQVIPDFDPSLLKIEFTVASVGSTGTSFEFAYRDAAGAESEPALYLLTYLPLPVTLVSLEGIADEGRVRLDWVTTAETNSYRFGVEHSIDARDWQEVGSVVALGESDEVHTYRFRHTSPLQGNNYYRLKMIDLGGTYEYSRILSVYMTGTASENIAVYPNPVLNPVSTKLFLPDGQRDVTYEIYDQNGGRRLTGTYTDGGIQVSSLQPGVYIIRFGRSEMPAQVKRFIIGK